MFAQTLANSLYLCNLGMQAATIKFYLDILPTLSRCGVGQYLALIIANECKAPFEGFFGPKTRHLAKQSRGALACSSNLTSSFLLYQYEALGEFCFSQGYLSARGSLYLGEVLPQAFFAMLCLLSGVLHDLL